MAISTTTTRPTPIDGRGVFAKSHEILSAAPDFHEVMQAYYNCRKNKRNKRGNILFESRLTENIAELHRDLNDLSYEIGASTCFVVTHPKPREVWAADFRDRVVHHIVHNRIADRYFRTFSANSCACIPGRGTHYAIRRLEHQVRSVTHNWTRRAYYLKMDISNFFMAIDKDVLLSIVYRKEKNPWVVWALEKIINHDPTTNYHFSGDQSLLGLIPPHKSLIGGNPRKGLPIGNLSSQFLANLYVNVLDKHVDHHIKPWGYVRYVDDVVMTHYDKQFLLDARDEITEKVSRDLKLKFNPTKTLLHEVSRGVDFVGYIVLPHRVAPRRAILYKAKRAMSECATSESVTQTANSYLGILSHAKSRAQRAAICNHAMRLGHSVSYDLKKVITV